MRDTHKDVTHSKLIEAATRVFAQHGYHKTTVDQIAREAGCSRATFYLHFQGKGDFLQPLLQAARDPFKPLYGLLPGILRVRDAALLKNWIIQAITLWDEVADYMRPVYEAAETDADLFRTLFPEELPGILEFDQALRESFPGLDESRYAITGAVIAAPLLHFFRRNLRGTPFDQDQTAETIARVWSHIVDDLANEQPAPSDPQPRTPT